MSKSVLSVVRRAIDYNKERAQERVESAREEIASLPDLLRERRQLKRWQKRAKTFRQADFTYIVMLFPSLDSLNDPEKLISRSVFMRSKKKFSDAILEAHTQFLKVNAKSACEISVTLSKCSVELRGGLRVELPSEVWLPLLGE